METQLFREERGKTNGGNKVFEEKGKFKFFLFQIFSEKYLLYEIVFIFFISPETPKQIVGAKNANRPASFPYNTSCIARFVLFANRRRARIYRNCAVFSVLSFAKFIFQVDLRLFYARMTKYTAELLKRFSTTTGEGANSLTRRNAEISFQRFRKYLYCEKWPDYERRRF